MVPNLDRLVLLHLKKRHKDNYYASFQTSKVRFTVPNLTSASEAKVLLQRLRSENPIKKYAIPRHNDIAALCDKIYLTALDFIQKVRQGEIKDPTYRENPEWNIKFPVDLYRVFVILVHFPHHTHGRIKLPPVDQNPVPILEDFINHHFDTAEFVGRINSVLKKYPPESISLQPTDTPRIAGPNEMILELLSQDLGFINFDVVEEEHRNQDFHS